MSELSNNIRFYHFVSGVLVTQQKDPLCRACKAFVNTVKAMRNGLDEFRENPSNRAGLVSEEMLCLIDVAYRSITSITISDDTVGQKKVGNCKMPEGVCFVKSSKAILKKI